MVCQQNEAKLHFTQIAGGKTHKVDLCEECAKAKGVNTASFSMADLLLGLGAAKEIEQSDETGTLKCPACGFTQADFKKTGRLGCPRCYAAYAAPLAPLLKSMHKGVRHVGKIPRAAQKTVDLESRLRDLQKKLEKAVAVEQFEEAAALRDEIRDLKRKRGGVAEGGSKA